MSRRSCASRTISGSFAANSALGGRAVQYSATTMPSLCISSSSTCSRLDLGAQDQADRRFLMLLPLVPVEPLQVARGTADPSGIWEFAISRRSKAHEKPQVSLRFLSPGWVAIYARPWQPAHAAPSGPSARTWLIKARREDALPDARPRIAA